MKEVIVFANFSILLSFHFFLNEGLDLLILLKETKPLVIE